MEIQGRNGLPNVVAWQEGGAGRGLGLAGGRGGGAQGWSQADMRRVVVLSTGVEHQVRGEDIKAEGKKIITEDAAQADHDRPVSGRSEAEKREVWGGGGNEMYQTIQLRHRNSKRDTAQKTNCGMAEDNQRSDPVGGGTCSSRQVRHLEGLTQRQF